MRKRVGFFVGKLGYVVPAFVVGTLVSGTVAVAATNYIQALKVPNAVLSVNGQSVSQVPALVSGNTMYAGLWWLQQGLNKVGYNATWNGKNFNITTPAPTSNGIALVNGYKASLVAQGTASQTNLDDIVQLNGHLFVTYQNGVGSKGEPASSGTTNSTIVEYDATNGTQIATWSVTGRCDGMGADPANNRVFATVNEDGNSSLYIITPGNPQPQHVTYSPDPAIAQSGPVATGGGTDNVVVQNGHIYITASAPAADSNGNYSHAAIFEATIQGNTATLTPVLMGNATASDAVSGKSVTLNLSDPDSSTIVPAVSPKFANDIMLDSQGDGELVFVQNAGQSNQTQTRLSMGTQVDDVQWATSSNGTLYVTDGGTGKLYAITGNFTPGTVFVACPGDSTVGGFVGTLDLSTGNITPIAIGLKSPKGLTFVDSH